MNDVLANYIGYKKVFSIFPELYNYGQSAPLILRIGIGFVFIRIGLSDFSKKGGWKILNITTGVIKITIGLMFIFALYTQIGAIIASIFSLAKIFVNVKHGDNNLVNYYILLFIISVSLIISGPGIFAIDLPL